MKKFFPALFVMLILSMPLKSYALVDAELFGGYAFGGNLSESKTDTVSGFGYGFRGHYNQSFLLLLDVGLGGFVQYSPLSYKITLDSGKKDADLKKTTFGLDAYTKVDVPLIPLKPYIRGGMAVFDKTTSSYQGNSESKTKYFNYYYGGLGLALTAIPVPIVDFQIFGEYLYEYSTTGVSGTLKNHRVNLGVSVGI